VQEGLHVGQRVKLSSRENNRQKQTLDAERQGKNKQGTRAHQKGNQPSQSKPSSY
jgi:hypothetical protein